MRTVAVCLALLLSTLLGSAAHAAQVEARAKLTVRERPSGSARIVDRVNAGKRMTVLGKSGEWTHVQTAKGDGWVPTAQVKRLGGGDEEEAAAEDNRPALAKRRAVRPEAWVSSTKYHDAEDTKLTVSAVKAELYGRPAAGGAVLGIVRRGETVQLVRKSTDKKWLLVDVGGGEVAWLEAKAVKPGAARGGQMPAEAEGVPSRDEEAPPPPPAPTRQVRREPPPEPVAPPPPPPRGKRRGGEQVARSIDNEQPVTRDRETARDEEAPPGMAPSRRAEPETMARAETTTRRTRMAREEDTEGVVVKKRAAGPSGKNFFGVGARGGLVIIQQAFRSNGNGPLTNYDASSNGYGIGINAAYVRAFGKMFRLGLGFNYLYGGGAAIRYRLPDKTLTIGLQSHTVDGGLLAGLHFDVIGGLDLTLQVGLGMQMQAVQPSVTARLPSDLVLGLSTGLGVSLPSFLVLAQRPLGAYLGGGVLAPAKRQQTVGLEDGGDAGTIGYGVGLGVSYGLLANPQKGQVSLMLGYSFAQTNTDFRGKGRRNTTITAAARSSGQHFMGLGVAWNY